VLLSGAAVAVAAVSVFPTPGSRFSLPQTQITFRGISPGSIGTVTVTGSVSGAHAGTLRADADGAGASFIPARPFSPGEKVTVTTGLSVLGASGGRFSFSIAHPGPALAPEQVPRVPAGKGGIEHFASRRDLLPASITVDQRGAPASQGDIFVAPQFGPSQDGPMILGPSGDLIWFHPTPVSHNVLTTDFRVQDLHGQPVLTWWQGKFNAGRGLGEGIIFDRNYHLKNVVRAGNGLSMDLHEFLVTPQGDAYFVAASPVRLPGVGREVIDSVVQEVEIKTGLVLFEWHALDHIGLGESYAFGPKVPGRDLGPFHVNSVALAPDGNLIVSARNTSAIYEVDHQTGAIIWRLGGKRSSFKLGKGARTAFQHDALEQPDGTITAFDDGAGPPRVHKSSRGVQLAIDTRNHTAKLIKAYGHSPALSANFEGSMQLLSSGDVFLGWGQRPYFSEDDASGKQLFDARFTAPTSSYRAYRFPWSGQPTTKPALAVSTGSGDAIITHESWNGATDISGWRVLAGNQPTSLQRIRSAPKYKFESTLTIHNTARYVQVQALARSGKVLASSPVVRVPGR
jgi:Arylsulfotransferase (ASST)